MSKERARRRAERLAVLEKERAARARKVARRQRRRAVLRRMTPPFASLQSGQGRRWGGRMGSPGRLHRRSRGQRVGIVVVPLVAVVLVWLLVPDLALRVVLTALIVIAVPALVVLVLGKRP